ncbi:xanthine dehydrogenase family protein molybdopterin-binding subunit [Mycobacterium sp.]|jgi:xanthine dehydrogenase YagR molybdenum-binding subunit|uniref:xanthine dehydrogenase family protein molybdopterin-binding subunit n=1 Tax=Mycobacterium sp. TaxID=1785 RepID=UPI002D5B5047|nr:xanthine dehydrogenase family protein molybdopterin-binding subunit [Mycobacterium sp.]HZA12531.1 xanthine dehydrogenase family protein molybdopterin-binding subunit [Mycobacterium sp.]
MTYPVRTPEPVTGQPLARVDGTLKVTGAAQYAADNAVPNLLHAVLVTSTVARGTVESVDSSAAVDHKGVLRVITGFRGLNLPFDPLRVAFFGQPVAVVVGSTLEAAAHGASLVQVRYSAAPQLTDIDAPQATWQTGTRQPDYARGDPDGALGAAVVVTDLQFAIPRYHHNAMELPSTIASWDGDRLTVWDKTQNINGAQEAFAKAFGIPVDQVRVVSPFVGGGFGSAGSTWPHQLIAAFTARQMRQPVKLVLSRKQMYSSIGYRPTSRQRLAIGADRSGAITAMIHEGHTETARYQLFEDAITGPAKSLYSCPNMRSTYRVVPLDVNLPCPMRGPGATPGTFVLESAMDDLAHRLGMDPVELRLRNEPERDQATGMPFSSRRLTDCLKQGAASFGWAQRNPTPRSVRDGNELVGFGMAAAGYHTNRSSADALVRVNADGTADVSSATSDMGPGTYTSMTQVAADALGLPTRRVRFALGDSRYPKAPSHSGSKTMASVGSAVFTAANGLRDKLIRTAVVDPASPLSGAAPQQVAVIDGRMFRTDDPTRGETYQELLARRGWPSLEIRQTWTPDDADKRFSMYAYGAVFAEVGVDEMLGAVRVRRIFGCYDAGRIINPKLAHSQAIGAMVMGTGMALLEGTRVDYRDGRIVNANMSDYLVPVSADVPALDAMFLAGEDTIADPIGVKGLGELVIVAVPPAIANAVFNATGKRITDLPITIEKLL